MLMIIYAITLPIIVLMLLLFVQFSLFFMISVEVTASTVDVINRMRQGATIEEAVAASDYSRSQLGGLCVGADGSRGYDFDVVTRTRNGNDYRILTASCDRFVFAQGGVVSWFGVDFPGGGRVIRTAVVDYQDRSATASNGNAHGQTNQAYAHKWAVCRETFQTGNANGTGEGSSPGVSPEPGTEAGSDTGSGDASGGTGSQPGNGNGNANGNANGNNGNGSDGNNRDKDKHDDKPVKDKTASARGWPCREEQEGVRFV